VGAPTPFDPDRILDTLQRNEARFVVIGGMAAIAQGAGWPTLDLDIVVATDAENMKALQVALAELGAEYDTLHQPPIRPDLARLTTFPGPQLFRTTHGRLDVLKNAGGETYESLLADCVLVEQDGRVVQCASIEALIRMKRAADRPKDREGLAALEAALAKQRGDGHS
jgi:hypothetical protein